MRSTSRRGSTAATAARGDCGSRSLATAPFGEPGRGVLSESAFGGSCSVGGHCEWVRQDYLFCGRRQSRDLVLPRRGWLPVPSSL